MTTGSSASSCCRSWGWASSAPTTCATSRSTPPWPPRRWSTPTPRNSFGPSRSGWNASWRPSGSSSGSPNRSSPRSIRTPWSAEIADRLGTLVPVDTLGLDTYDARAGLLIPMYARGVDADQFLGRTMSDQEGVGGWVARNGRAQLVEDELADPRVAHFEGGPVPGCLIVAPLHGRDGVAGILTLERMGRMPGSSRGSSSWSTCSRATSRSRWPTPSPTRRSSTGP